MVTLLERIFPPTLPSQGSILETAKMMLEWRAAEKERLDKVHAYWTGQQPHPSTPIAAPADLTRLAKMSRVNIMDIVISAVSQTLSVEGYREEDTDQEAPAWAVWQANKLDAEQAGIHDAALAYGTSYVTVLPGDPLPTIRGYSPRFMTALYGDDPDWPLWALSADPAGNRWTYRLYDSNAIHFLSSDAQGEDLTFIETRTHDLGITPVVRFRDRVDLDGDNRGQIEPLMEIQDQIDHTTFGLKVAEHFAAFRQRYVIGWTASSEEEKLKTSVTRVWTFEDKPEDIKVGEFGQTDLSGYLESRDASIRNSAVISQTPPHYILGQLVNLSAEALVASEASLMRKSRQRQHSFGESHEQVLQLAGRMAGFDASDSAQVRWADAESRAFATTVDGITKLQAIGVPLELLLERIPGFTQQDVERAKSIIAAGDPLAQFGALLEQQTAEDVGVEA